jgi:hypothetical protein
MSDFIHWFGEERREGDKVTKEARKREKLVKDEDKENIVHL